MANDSFHNASNPFAPIPWWKRVFSYVYPVEIQYIGHQDIILAYHKGQYQLVTHGAIYSDGNRYKPYAVAFPHIKTLISKDLKNCLVLGTGLGSVPQILMAKYNADPHYDLVDTNAITLQWARQLLATLLISNVHTHATDANVYVQNCTQQYELITVDVFDNCRVPQGILQADFISRCKNLLTKNGVIIMNYIVIDEEEWSGLQSAVRAVFGESISIINYRKNKLIIMRNS